MIARTEAEFEGKDFAIQIIATGVFIDNGGGNGVIVCPEWRNSFEAFREWALANGYCDNLTIDRIDSNGNYEPSNCQWLSGADNTRKADYERWHKK